MGVLEDLCVVGKGNKKMKEEELFKMMDSESAESHEYFIS